MTPMHCSTTITNSFVALNTGDLNEYTIRIFRDIVSNYEEFCELHQSVVELEQIIRENTRRAEMLEKQAMFGGEEDPLREEL